MINRRLHGGFLAALIVYAWWAVPAHACSHTWLINEVFSNADGTIQFIELEEPTGSNLEGNLSGLWFSTDSDLFDFRDNLTGPTGNQHFLMATQGFADLPGAPQPDFIIPDNFFSTSGDTLSYFLYTSFAFTNGQLPTNGSTSLQGDGSTALNSPTNFAGQTTTLQLGPPPIPTLSEWGMAALAVMLLGAGTLTLKRRRHAVPN